MLTLLVFAPVHVIGLFSLVPGLCLSVLERDLDARGCSAHFES
jgi:hypothetical protein